MKIFKLLAFLICSISYSAKTQTIDVKKLSPVQAKSDIEYFKNVFFSAHIYLALVCDTSVLKQRLDTLISGLNDSIYSSELYTRLMPVFTSIRDIHCSLHLPPENNDYFQSKKLYLPLNIFCSKGDLYVYNDYYDSCIAGSKILAINDVSADSIYSLLMIYSSSEGDNIHSREKIAELYFPSIYPLNFSVDSLNKIVVEHNSDTITHEIPGVIAKKEPYRSFFEKNKLNDDEPFEFGFSNDYNIAYIKIASFISGFPGEYKYFLNNVFRHIKIRKPKALILDLRNNTGGYANEGKLLTQYLMPEKYTYINNVVSKSSNIIQQEILKQSPLKPEIIRLTQYYLGNKSLRTIWKKQEGVVDTVWEKKIKPINSRKVYLGYLIVMFNGLSASTTGLVCNTLRHRPNTVFAGLPAGCAVSGTFGQPTAYELPNSGIKGVISILRFNQDTLPPVLTPIMPDIELPENPADIYTEKDSQLNQIMNIILDKIHNQ
jgi:hypothetical protein